MSPSAGQSCAAESQLLLANALTQLWALAKSSFLFAHHCFHLDAKDLCLLPIFTTKINANFSTCASE